MSLWSTIKTSVSLRRSRPALATKTDLQNMENRIMSVITDWATKEQADLTDISSALDAITVGVAALDSLVSQLQSQLTGIISEDDQKALDALAAASKDLVAKAQAISTAPPVPPVPPAPPAPPSAAPPAGV